MSVVAFANGFDNLAVANYLRRYDAGNNTGFFSLQSSRIGSGNSWRFGTGNCYLTQGTGVNMAAPIMGAGIRSAGGNTSRFFGLLDSGSYQLELAWVSTGQLRILSNNTTRATSVATLANDTWYFIEMVGAIGNSVTVDVYVDGVLFLTASGIDTQSTASAQYNQYRIGSQDNTGVQIDFDDFYLIDAANDSPWPTARLGDIKVGTYHASAAGDDANFTPLSSTNISNVDETTVADDDTTYNESTTVNHKDTFKATNPGLASGASVHWIQTVADVRKTDAGASVMRGLVKSNTTYEEGADFAPSTTYRQMISKHRNNPATSALWTPASLENTNLQIGYKKTA
jgi:hypothetical protein